MHGEGQFVHRDEFVFYPTFCNNLVFDGEFFINPYMTKDQAADYVQRYNRSCQDQQNARREKMEKITCHAVHDLPTLKSTIRQIRGNGRTPLIVSTVENPIEIEHLMDIIQDPIPNREILDLRQLASHLPIEEWAAFR